MVEPRVVWGKIITYLRENKNIALQMACGDIRDISIVNGKLIAKTEEEYIFNMLSTEYSKNEIKKALKWLEIDIDFELEQKERPKDLAEEDIKKLEKLVGEYLTIRE